MSWFLPKNEKLDEIKAALKQATTSGDYACLDALLTGECEPPQKYLVDALERAINNDQTKLAAYLIGKGALVNQLGESCVRRVVHTENKAIFRLLLENDIDFTKYAPESDSEARRTLYLTRVKYLRSDVACEDLRHELSALTNPSQTTPSPLAPPRKKADRLGF